MGGFAIYPAPGRGNDDDGTPRTRHSSLPPSARTTPVASARTSVSSLDAASDDGQQHTTLEMPPSSSSRKHRWSGLGRQHGSGSRSARLFQKLRTVLPVLMLTPRCGRLPDAEPSSGQIAAAHHLAPFPGATRPWRRVTGTLYGRRKGRVALALQETPRCVPSLVVELALQTHALLRELGNPAGARIVLETEDRRRRGADSDDPESSGGGGGRRRRPSSHGPALLLEPRWTMFCNGRKTGYAVRREAAADDLRVLETLWAVSMGAGVLPGRSAASGTSNDTTPTDDEVPYMRGSFDHFVGSRDSESLYMVAPQGGGTGPELAIFFVRL